MITKKRLIDYPFTLPLMMTLIIGFIVFFIPIQKEKDFYDYHVGECHACHSLNLSFLLCSGFCVKPDYNSKCDDSGGCMEICPNVSCEKNIPHGSLTYQYEWRFGLINWFRP